MSEFVNFIYANGILLQFTGFLSLLSESRVAKSSVHVVRVVHLLFPTRNFFQLTCLWTSEKNWCQCLKSKINTSNSEKFAANIEVENKGKHLIIDLIKVSVIYKVGGVHLATIMILSCLPEIWPMFLRPKLQMMNRFLITSLLLEKMLMENLSTQIPEHYNLGQNKIFKMLITAMGLLLHLLVTDLCLWVLTK